MTLAASTPALTRLVGGELDRFTEGWGSDALEVPRALRGGDGFDDLFSADAVDELISRRGLRTPFVRMARAGSTLADSAITSSGGVGAGVGDQLNEDKIRRQFADGATIVLQGLHRTWTPIREFSDQLAAELGHPVQVNAYVTPAQSQGFSAHYDVHDVFILQVAGHKRWLPHPPVVDAPLREQTWDRHADEVAARASETPTIDAELTPGDVLYLPRGHVHSARALGGVTIHLTVGIHVWTQHHLAEVYLDAVRAALAADPTIRAALPLGIDVADPDQLRLTRAAVREAVETAAAEVTTDQLSSALLRRARAGRRPSALGPLAQLAAADGLTPDAGLRLRPGLLATIEANGDDQVVVASRAGRCVLPGALRPALERLLAGDIVRAGDLGDDARTILVAGIAVTA